MSKHENWLSYAEDDLNACATSVRNAAYLAQQCAEKALKGYLVFKKKQVKRTHDLIELLFFCVQLSADFKELANEASWLNPFSTDTRYPDDILFVPDVGTVKALVSDAEKILNFVHNKIAGIE